MTISKIYLLADFNLAVRYGVTICIHVYVHVSKKFWRIFIWRLHRQTVKLPSFLAIQQIVLKLFHFGNFVVNLIYVADSPYHLYCTYTIESRKYAPLFCMLAFRPNRGGGLFAGLWYFRLVSITD